MHLQYITVNQLVSNVYWLYGALQTALLHHGKLIVKEFERSQDGILCYWKFVKAYRFGGNVPQYIGRQQEVLTQLYHPNYNGGELGFLNDYVEAFSNIEYVLQKEDDQETTALYTEKGKRELFVRNFSVPQDTQDMITGIEQRTTTWEAMVDELRYQISRRTASSRSYAKRKAHLCV